jgi:hypothetical protein
MFAAIVRIAYATGKIKIYRIVSAAFDSGDKPAPSRTTFLSLA